MPGFFRRLFGKGVDFVNLIKGGATILDVRSIAEYGSGHVKGSINIPLDELPRNLDKLQKDKPVIACCASGGRSASAKAILKANGYEVYNGGSWLKVNKLLVFEYGSVNVA